MRQSHKNDNDGMDLFQDKVKEIVDEVKEKGRALLSDGLETAKEVFEEQSDHIKKKASEMKEKSFEDLSDDMKGYVKKNPLKSVALALGVGILLGYLFKSDK